VVSCRLSPVTMPARIARGVRLRFDNAAANPASPHVADDRLPDEISGQLRHIDWQAGPRQQPDIVFNVQSQTPLLECLCSSARGEPKCLGTDLGDVKL
jgi:hypothetical protein